MEWVENQEHMPVEEVCRRFAGNSLRKAYGTLGITGASWRRAISNSMEAAERAWRQKGGDVWGPQNATWTKAGLQGKGCLFKDTKHPMTPGNNTDDVSQV